MLLIRTEMPVKQVAYNSYFNDPKVFMRRFKSSTGLSPSEYRKSYNLIHLNNPHVDLQIPKRIADSIDYIPENGDISE
ncbi:helix-turn-helix domain-containing protein [Lentilactobacillus hilgardii]|uniref:helix-turn-helix domain-containing protein n=1 Tax=Lentilactobacillus hilgardii TaxID=1588 RepID=UPI0021C4794F|nr:helix-turn-helix domain-containing protein [Lentilactobacillus hilgardii]